MYSCKLNSCSCILFYHHICSYRGGCAALPGPTSLVAHSRHPPRHLRLPAGSRCPPSPVAHFCTQVDRLGAERIDGKLRKSRPPGLDFRAAQGRQSGGARGWPEQEMSARTARVCASIWPSFLLPDSDISECLLSTYSREG